MGKESYYKQAHRWIFGPWFDAIACYKVLSRMLYRSVIFTNAPLLKGYRYRDKFQLVPMFYFHSAPFCKYACHFPAFIEYEAEESVEQIGIEDYLREKGLGEESIEMSSKLPNQVRVRREILLLLTSLTNFHFFEYMIGGNSWGVQVPLKDIDKLTEEESKALNTTLSYWFVRSYTYPELKDDMKIESFTQCSEYYEAKEDSLSYFMNNPNIENNPEIKFAFGTQFCLDRYFQMEDELKTKVRRCVGLLADGVDLFDTKRSLSSVSIVSCIEGMAKIDYDLYGKTPGLGATSRFTRYLKQYVAGMSEDKYKAYYKKRCDIAHEGFMMTGDVDIYSDIKEQDAVWRLRLEILQAARMSLHHWLRRKLK